MTAAVFGKDPASAYRKFRRYLLTFFTLSNKIICLASVPGRNCYSTKFTKNAALNTNSTSIPPRQLTMENRNKIDNFDVNNTLWFLVYHKEN